MTMIPLRFSPFILLLQTLTLSPSVLTISLSLSLSLSLRFKAFTGDLPMVESPESSSTALLNDDKPVIVRVKRKSYQSPLEAFWLEINERPVKRPLLDFEKLSINNSSSKVEELKTKKVFVQHVDTVSSSEVAADFLQTFVASKPNSADALANALDSKVKLEDQRRSNKSDNKQKQLLAKAKETQEILAKNARFEQIWKSRKRNRNDVPDDALRDMCKLYDVVRVDVGETSDVQEQEDEEEQRLMSSFLPLLHEFIPSAAEEIESEINNQIVKQASKDDYVYDLYAVKDDIVPMDETNSHPFPLVQVDNDDDFYDGPDNSDYETDDSNAEDNPMNDYPDEEEEDESKSSDEEDSEEVESDEPLTSESARGYEEDWLEDEMLINLDEEDDEGYW